MLKVRYVLDKQQWRMRLARVKDSILVRSARVAFVPLYAFPVLDNLTILSPEP